MSTFCFPSKQLDRFYYVPRSAQNTNTHGIDLPHSNRTPKRREGDGRWCGYLLPMRCDVQIAQNVKEATLTAHTVAHHGGMSMFKPALI